VSISKTTQGFLTILFASSLFGLMALLVKIAAGEFSAAQILFMRGIIGLALIVPLIWARRASANPQTLKPLVWRGISGGIAVSLYFYAITKIPLADASILANAYPIFAAFFSAVYLRERVKLITLVALLVSLSGMFLIMQPHFSYFDFAYVLAGISAIFAGLAITLVRQLRQSNSSLIIMLSQIIGILVFSAPFVVSNFSWPANSAWLLLLMIGFVSTVSQLIFTIPFRSVPAAEGSIVAINHAAFAVLFAVIFLAEPLSANFLLGSLLIFGSSLYIILRQESPLQKN